MKKGVFKFLLAQSSVSCVYQVEVVFLDVPNDSTSTVATRRLLQKTIDQFITYELSLSYLFGKVFSQQTSNGRNAVSSSNCSNYSINIFIPFLPYYPVTLFSYPLPNIRSRLLLSNISHKLLLIIWNYL